MNAELPLLMEIFYTPNTIGKPKTKVSNLEGKNVTVVKRDITQSYFYEI